MANVETVYVIGAGAGVDFRMPTGDNLTKNIVAFVDKARRQTTRNPHLSCRVLIPDTKDFSEACVALSSGLPLSVSIDEFLHLHSDKPHIEKLGKLAITSCILEREAGALGGAAINGTWMKPFWQSLSGMARREEIADRLSRIAFVNFNYDRVLERSLHQILMMHCKYNNDTAAEIVNKVRILHPYGTVGRLDFMEGPGPTVSFGSTNEKLRRDVSQTIRTYTEDLQTDKRIMEFRSIVQNVKRLVFLGFGFHRQNVALLAPAPDQPKKARPEVYATAYHMSDFNRDRLKYELTRDLNLRGEPPYPSLHLEDIDCKELFSRFARKLQAG